MKLRGKLKIVAMLTATVFGLTACQGTKDQATNEAQAEAVKELTAQERYEAMNAAGMEVESMAARISMDMGLNMGGESLVTTMEMDMVSFTDPLKTKMVIDMDMGELGSQSMETYVELTEEGVGMVYVYDGTTWTKQEMTNLSEVQEQYNVKNSIGAYTNGFSDFKEAGREEIEGRKVVKITGVLTGEALKNSIMETGALNSVQGLMTEEQVSSLYDGFEGQSAPVEFWVDEETNEMVKASMDMTEVMNLLYENMFSALDTGEGFSISVDRLTVVIDEIQYNDVEDFEIPEEAKQ